MTVPAPPVGSSEEPFDRLDHTPRSTEGDYGAGVYRRRIRVRLADDTATGELEDDFHHFRVDLRHDGRVVTAIEGSGIRSPWTMCLTAGDPLRALTGVALVEGPTALAGHDAKRNCTHMFDLAGLLITHTARGVAGDRLYDMEVTEPAGVERAASFVGKARPTPSESRPEGTRRARLWRDGELVLEWYLEGRTLLGPDEWLHAPLWAGLIPWAARELDPDTAEAVVALRRACEIASGRDADLDVLDTAEPLLDVMPGICHTFQPEHAPVAVRHKGSARDFTDHPHLLLADFDARR